MKKLLHSHKGQSLVEFALVLPLLLTVLLGIAEFGRIFGGYVELQSATRDLARYAAVHNLTTATGLSTLKDERLTLLDPTKATLTFLRTEDKANKDTWVKVTITYPMDLMTPFIGSIIHNNTITLTSNMVMRVE